MGKALFMHNYFIHPIFYSCPILNQTVPCLTKKLNMLNMESVWASTQFWLQQP